MDKLGTTKQRGASLGGLETTLLAVGGHLEHLVFSIGNWVFLCPELQFGSLGCFLYRRGGGISKSVCVFCCAHPGGRESQNGLPLGHVCALK